MHDPIAYFWVLLWVALGSYGLYLLKTEDKRAASFYAYGKSLDLNKKKGLFWQLFFMPKRFFMHFYVTALLIFFTCFAMVFIYYIPSRFSAKLQSQSKQLVNFITMNKQLIRIESADSISSITALIFTMILMIIQSTRRLYETSFISVFSSNSKINIIHYIYGHAFYLMAALSTIIPIIVSQTSNKYNFTNIIDNLLTKQRAIAFILFVYASHEQQKCNKVLANLRKDKSGRVITDQHYVPSGGLFEYVTCPHFLTEVVIYFLILVVQEFKQTYWNLIFLLVLSTQTIKAITEHRWYKKKYKDYSKERKAIFPRLL